MGFGEFDPDAEVSSKPSSSSSSSGGGGGGGSPYKDGFTKLKTTHVPAGKSEEDYPFYCKKCPNYLLLNTDEGYEWHSWASAPELTFEKHSPNDRWELVDDGEIELVYWDESDFKRVRHIAEEQLGVKIVQLLKEKPEEGLDIIDLASRMAKGNSPAYEHVSCYVCDKKYHAEHGDYHTVNGHAVCGSHEVSELAERDLI